MPTKIFVAGHHGMAGSAILRNLQQNPQPSANIDLICRTRAELDLTDQAAVKTFFQEQAIDQVYLAAARVGGIHANNAFPADFIYQNLMIQGNVINAAFESGVEKLLFLGSSCIYPRLAAQPMSESELLQGPLEATNLPYAVAKIAGIKLCESYNRQHGTDYRSVMPTNLYGPNDNFHPENSHVIPAMMRRFHEAKLHKDESVMIWGSGKPYREFLYADDMASACVHVMNLGKQQHSAITEPNLSHINIGTGEDISIKSLAELIAEVVEFEGHIEFDLSKPDGTPKKLLNVSRLDKSGWQARTNLEEGLQMTYRWFKQNQESLRGVDPRV